MHAAAIGGNVDIIKMLVNAQGNIYAKDDNWNTPLHLAAKYGRAEAVKYLIQLMDELQSEVVDEEAVLIKDTSYFDEAILSGQRYRMRMQ